MKPLRRLLLNFPGMEAGGKMHIARSRNDQVVLDVRMNRRDDINEICVALASRRTGTCAESKREQAGSYADVYPFTTGPR